MFRPPLCKGLQLLSKHIKNAPYQVRNRQMIPKRGEGINPLGNTMGENFAPGESPDHEAMIPSKKELRIAKQFIKKECYRMIDMFKGWAAMEFAQEIQYDKTYRIFSFGRGENIKNWGTLCDKDEGYGYSSCKFETSRNGCAVFSGNLSTQVRSDGVSHRSGFCAIRAPVPYGLYATKGFYNWEQYTHLVFRVRGDGRSYMINLGSSGYIDTTWYNSHNYALFTRGGPYWQVSKIPFSKFILTHKGYIQDKQHEVGQDEITWFGITLMDGYDGPFHLEIDYIGLLMSGTHDEIHAYETYKHVNHLGDN